MEQRVFGSGRQVGIVGQGTWQFDAKRQAVAALQKGIACGMTHIDTAEMYDGAEAIVAEAMIGRRDEIFLVSKLLPSHASRAGTIKACEASLRRLRTGHLDCYLLHWPGPHPIADTIEAFERLVEQGKIRSWGLSNFDVSDLEAAWRTGGAGRIACNQVLYHLKERAIEHAVLPWCAEHGVSVVAYSPYGSGDFPAPGSAGGQVLAAIAARHAATPRQVALRYLTRAAGTFTIPKASDAAHAAENGKAGSLTLTESDCVLIAEAFPLGAKPRSLPMI